MGLTVTYGYLEMVREDPEGIEWFQQDLAAVNDALAAEGLPLHVEPSTLPPHHYRFDLGSISWSWLHCLRRIHAHALQSGQLVAPAPTPFDDLDDEAVDCELTVYMRSHLICHSDSEGWYVPLDFADVIYDDRVPGGMLGSAPRLLGELRLDAALLGIALDASGALSDAEAARVNAIPEDDPYFRETTAWLALFEAARLGCELGTAVLFK